MNKLWLYFKSNPIGVMLIGSLLLNLFFLSYYPKTSVTVKNVVHETVRTVTEVKYVDRIVEKIVVEHKVTAKVITKPDGTIISTKTDLSLGVENKSRTQEVEKNTDTNITKDTSHEVITNNAASAEASKYRFDIVFHNPIDYRDFTGQFSVRFIGPFSYVGSYRYRNNSFSLGLGVDF